MAEFKEGWGVIVGGDEGEWAKGTRVRKIKSKPDDAHQDGAEGVIVGAMGPIPPGTRAEIHLDLARDGKSSEDVVFIYWVVWDDMPGVPVAIIDPRIEPWPKVESV